MARRAAGALVAMLALGGMAAPAALFAAASPPAAAASGIPATITFTGLSPEWVNASSRLTATVSVKNTGPVAESLAVELFYYSDPIASVDELQQIIAAGNANGRNPILLPGTTWQTPVLRPGATVSRSFQVPVTAMKLKRFGVYPLDAQVSNSQGSPLNNTLTYLPYVPAKNGAFSSSLPPARKISLVWPLIDQPLLDQPWQGDCTGRQSAMLAQSLATGGRLRELLDAGSASSDAITWAVDPALLANAAALSRCGRREPQWAHAASDWLSQLRTATARQPLFLTPYGDPEVATLIAHGHGLDQDVDNAFTSGRIAASQILHRNDLVPGTAGAGQSVQAITAAMAWSAGGPTRYSTLEHLGARDDVASLLLSSSELPPQGTVVRTPDGTGRIMNLLLANDSITKLLGSGGAQGSAASTAQEFLAETALLAMQGPAPIIVAPPHRWQPAPGLAPRLLSGIASAPWLSAATLASLTTSAQIPTVPSPTGTAASGIGSAELRQLLALHDEAIQLQKLEAQPDPNVIFAVSTAESSAYERRQRATALSVIGTLKDQITRQLQTGVRILTEGRITL
ncbi:MAG: hypothetical protein J2P29_13980, partial [Actinobacteria bacterium]|nr:hypothetical protein [Actinomycetota bacterium]